jgi:leader peptidase (prepilin peptidase)/N-methyltransferase
MPMNLAAGLAPILGGPAIDALIIALAAPLGWSAGRAAQALTAAEGAPAPRAPIVIGVAMLMAAAVLAAGPTPPAAAGAALGWGLLTLAVVDLLVFRLPDAVTLPLIATGLAAAAADLDTGCCATGFSPAALLDHSLGAVLGYGGFAAIAALSRRARGRDGLGLGDAKLAACGGAWLGWAALPAMVLIACGLAFVWVALRLIRRGQASLREPLPFGPPLALAIWILWLAPSSAGGG